MNTVNPIAPRPDTSPDEPREISRVERGNPVQRIHSFLWLMQKSLSEALESLVNYEADALLIRGKEKHSNLPLEIFYFGTRDNLAFLVDVIYSEHRIIEKGTNLNQLQARSWVKRYQARVQMVVLDLNWPFFMLIPKRGFLNIPPWIDMSLYLADTWESVQARFRKHVRTSDLRIVRKHGLDFRATRSEQAFSRFYHEMYVPYVRNRFGDAALIDPEEKVVKKRARRHGILMEIMRGESVIAAGLLIEAESSLACAWLGLAQEIDPSLLDGAMNGLYYYNIRYAFESGFKQARFFGCRPLLRDGALRFKRKWGATAEERQDSDGRILIRAVGESLPVESFLVHNPLITHEDRKLIAKALYDQHRLSVEDIHRAADLFYTEGLASLEIYSLHGFDDDVSTAVQHGNLPIALIDLSASENPLQDYCQTQAR